MNLEDYRKEFAAFQTAHHQALWDGWRARNPAEPLPEAIFERFQDLSSLSTIETLRQEQALATTRFETERRAIDALLGFANHHFLTRHVRAVDEELEKVQTRPYIQWEAQSLSWHEAERLIAREPRRDRRQALHLRWEQLVASAGDMFEERQKRFDEAAQQLGFTGYSQFRDTHQTGNGRSPARLAEHCDVFLRQTEDRYFRFLREWATENHLSGEAVGLADALFWQHGSDEETLFPATLLTKTTEQTLRGLGIRPWQQTNIKTVTSSERTPLVACVRIPEDIRISFRRASGWTWYRKSLRALARVQHAAWTSPRLPVELRYEGDRAISESFAALFESVLYETQWLGAMLDIPDPARVCRREQRARHVKIRQLAVLALSANEWQANTHGSGKSAESISEQIREKTGFGYTPGETRYLLSGEVDYHAQWQACCFEAQLRDYLKTHYGSWWKSRKAGDLLTDVWNTGFRYTTTELAAQIGLGEITPEALMEEFLHHTR